MSRRVKWAGKRRKVSRRSPREEILDAANATRDPMVPAYYMPHINEAVFKCRQWNLVAPEVLMAAGFNPKRRRCR